MVKELTAELRLVLDRSVETLSLIEACRTAQPKLNTAAETLIKIIQVVLPFIYEEDNGSSVPRSVADVLLMSPNWITIVCFVLFVVCDGIFIDCSSTSEDDNV